MRRNLRIVMISYISSRPAYVKKNEMLIVYRCSDKGNVRERPDWISLFGCLRNLLEGVTDEDTLVVLCDNCEDATFESVRDIVGGSGVR